MLLIISFIWSGFCSVITAIAQNAQQKAKKFWHLGRSIILVFSLMSLIVPFYLFEPIEAAEKKAGIVFDRNNYKVGIIYQDDVFNRYYGFKDLNQCVLYDDIVASSDLEAIRKAERRFTESPESDLYKPKRGSWESGKARIIDSVAQKLPNWNSFQ
jgi:hypothetical protein